MQKLFALLIVFALFSGCQTETEENTIGDLKIISSEFSECLGHRASSLEEFQEMYIVRGIGDHNYIIEHKNATFNCCLDEGIGFVIELKNDTLFFTDYEKVKGYCKCICEYNTSAEIGEIEEGNYELYLTTGENFVGSVELNFKPDMYVEIPVSDLIESL